jgi:DMSO/TMAO reductase YedYZ molybdopterin-dependent catalytic subunit
VLHAGDVPAIDLETWRFRVWGLVEEPFELTFQEFSDLLAREITADIHCVTGWSKFDTVWRGTSGSEVVKRSRPVPEARYVMVHAPQWSTNLPLDDLCREDVVFAWEYDGRPLEAAHGRPVRLVVPHLYFWKSAKWVTGIEFVAEDKPGFWERAGYHMRGDPWREQRYRQ